MTDRLPTYEVRPHAPESLSAVPPHPDLLDRFGQQMSESREAAGNLVHRRMRFS